MKRAPDKNKPILQESLTTGGQSLFAEEKVISMKSAVEKNKPKLQDQDIYEGEESLLTEEKVISMKRTPDKNQSLLNESLKTGGQSLFTEEKVISVKPAVEKNKPKLQDKPLKTGGKSLTINSKVTNDKHPLKFENAFKFISEKARNYCDEAEWFYFLEAKKQFLSNDNFGWQTLSLQEKKIIHGLEEYKIPAYLGYRFSFQAGINRKDYRKKPIFALLEVSSACNLKCPFCFQSDPSFTTKEFMGIIDTKLAFDVIDQIDDMKIRGITIASRGEPLLYNDLEILLDHIGTKENIIEIKINTNAKRLTESRLRRLINTPLNILVVSTDHYEKEQYEKYRHGGNYENFVTHISKINQIRSEYNRKNNLYTRASGVMVDKDMDKSKFNDFYQQYFDESASVTLTAMWDTYSNNLEDSVDLSPCGMPFEKLYIWHDGTTNPCDVDYKSLLSPGKVGPLSLKECWENMQNLRDSMLSNKRHLHKPCDRCYVN